MTPAAVLDIGGAVEGIAAGADEVGRVSDRKPLFELGQDVEGLVDGVVEVGLVSHRHYSEYDSQWLYKVELVDDSQVFMLEDMLTRANHDEVQKADVLTVVDAAIQASDPMFTPTKESSWLQRFESAIGMGREIAERLYIDHFEDVETVWEALAQKTQQFYLALFAEPSAEAIA